MCFDEAIWPLHPQTGESVYKLGNPSSDNANGAKLAPPTFLPPGYRRGRRQAAETFDNRRPLHLRPTRTQHTAADRERAREDRLRACGEEANQNPKDPAAQARLPTDFVIRKRGDEEEYLV